MNRALSVLLVCVLVVPRVARAQDAPAAVPVSWSVMAGGEGATGTFRGEFSGGVVIGALVQFPLPSRRLAIRTDVLVHEIQSTDLCAGIPNCFQYRGLSTLLSVGVSMVARLRDPAAAWSPYAIGGVAGYGSWYENGNVIAMRPSHFGFQGGVGFEVRDVKHAFFVEARYMGISPGGVVPVTIGMRF
jgi:hypothetical protein